MLNNLKVKVDDMQLERSYRSKYNSTRLDLELARAELDSLEEREIIRNAKMLDLNEKLVEANLEILKLKRELKEYEKANKNTKSKVSDNK